MVNQLLLGPQRKFFSETVTLFVGTNKKQFNLIYVLGPVQVGSLLELIFVI